MSKLCAFFDDTTFKWIFSQHWNIGHFSSPSMSPLSLNCIYNHHHQVLEDACDIYEYGLA